MKVEEEKELAAITVTQLARPGTNLGEGREVRGKRKGTTHYPVESSERDCSGMAQAGNASLSPQERKKVHRKF